MLTAHTSALLSICWGAVFNWLLWQVSPSLSRLVSAQTDQKGGGQYSETYAYDPVGNLVNKGDDCYGYWQEDCGVPGDSAPRELKPHAVTHLNGVQKFWYDANGNMTRRIEGGVTYEQTFNSENRLSSVAVGGSTTTFIYDADGNRIQTIEPGGTTTTYPFPGYEEAVHNGAVTRRTTYSLGGQAVALRVQGPGSENDLYYLITDRLGSTRLVLSEGGSAVPGSTARYLPFGDWRTEPTSNLTDRGFTGHMQENLGNNDLGLIYMRARFFVPYINRFISADTIVPDPTNPQSFNRYSYALNNPVKYTDPSGHCVFIPPFDTAVCIALLALALTGDSAQPAPPPPNYPVNNTSAPCNSPLPDCFGDTVYLKDFAGYGEDNPIPIAEFKEFADKVAEDLYSHDLSWPGYAAGRGAYDTPFYNNGQSERRTNDPNAVNGLWPADQQVCIETIGCSGRSEVNYIAQGMWGAATGEPLPVSEGIVRLWKGWEYFEPPSEDTLFWLQYGYDYYLRWLEEQE